MVDVSRDRNRLARLRPARLPVGLHDHLRDLDPVRHRRAGRGRQRVLPDHGVEHRLGIVHGILGVLFVITGSGRSWTWRSAFTTLAALVAFFLLFVGIFDLTVAFMTKDEFDLWWLQLILGIVEIVLAFWVAGSFRQSAILLVVYVGVIALSRGITELFLALRREAWRKRLAAV